MKQWSILETGRGGGMDPDMGFRDEVGEAYRSGYRKGFEDAMRETAGMSSYKGDMGFRGDPDNMGERYPRYPDRDRMGFRDDDPYSRMGERRSRDSHGRYM